MEHRTRLRLAVAGTVALFLFIQLGALALVEPFDTAGLQPVENPDDPTTPLLYVGAILLATAMMLVAFKFNLQSVIRAGVILACVMLAWFALIVIVPPVLSIAGYDLLAAFLALLVGLGLAIHPEWYVIDAAGVLIGAAAAGLFGISFGILPAIILLVVLAVYDAISVYGTKHMLSLADGIMDVKVPVLLIVPVSLSYSFLAESSAGGSDQLGRDPERRDALFIGLGDAVIPTILVASAAYFVQAPALHVPGLAINVPALCAMIGTITGLVVLLRMVLRGRPHAGLPLLCGGAIGGYLVGSLLIGVPVLDALGVSPYL